MTITISLPPETEEKLRQAAAQSGVAPDAYAQKLIETGLRGGVSADQHSRPETFDEILAPVRKGFEESGMSEDELASLFEEAREEAWQDFPALKILDPVAFLRELAATPSDS